MEENTKKDQNQDQSQGKQSTAETNVNYHLDAEDLRHSSTTSMADADEDAGVATSNVDEFDADNTDADNTDTDDGS
jgi:hypothetical protein